MHKHQKPIERQNLYIYTSVQRESETETNSNLDACAHLFHSDRERQGQRIKIPFSANKYSMWGITRQYELFDKVNGAASLMHTVIFHTNLDQIVFHQDGKTNWYYCETWSNRIADGRVLHRGMVYDAEGNHLITTIQDGAMRFNWENDDERLKRQNEILKNPKL
jgi:hypothetical protein